MVDSTYKNLEITDEELLILASTVISKFCKKKNDQRKAWNQAEDWKSDSEKVDYYGSKARAESMGFDNYMDLHGGGDYTLLNAVIDQCEERKRINSRH